MSTYLLWGSYFSSLQVAIYHGQFISKSRVLNLRHYSLVSQFYSGYQNLHLNMWFAYPRGMSLVIHGSVMVLLPFCKSSIPYSFIHASVCHGSSEFHYGIVPNISALRCLIKGAVILNLLYLA